MSFRFKLSIAATVVFATLTACEQPNQSTSAGRFGFDSNISKTGEVPHSIGASKTSTDFTPGALQRGTDTFINSQALKGQKTGVASVIPAGPGKVELSLIDASIAAAAEAIIKEALGLNYVVDDGVSGKVTVQTTGPVSKKVLIDLFETALSIHNAKLVKKGDIVKITNGRTGYSSFSLATDGVAARNSIVVAPLKYISATEMSGLLEPLVGDGLKIIADKPRNLLMLSGPQTALNASLDALNLFDVDVLKGKSIALVTLSSAKPEDIARELETIFSSEEAGSLNGVIEFVPNDRLGSILVITSRSSYLDRAQRWIKKLDQSASQGEMVLRSYPLKNRSATELAPILNDLFAQKDSGSSATAGTAVISSSNATRIAADEARNALIVRAEGADHSEIASMISNLDTAARQVLLEATIAEVALNDEVNVGTRWFFEKGNWNFNFSDLNDGAVNGNATGFTAVFGAGGASVALSALSSVTDVNIISSPTLMVVDNKEGVLQIGDQVPIATQTSSQTNENSIAVTQVSYRDTGIILKVLPRVGASGRVSLDITQEVSDVASTRTSGIDSPTISSRKISTSVVLSDGQTLALGGLVQESDNKTRAQVPGAGNLPVLGALFGNRNSRKSRTELLILIRPRVVYDPTEASAATAAWRNKLNASSSILQTGLGSGTHSFGEVLN